MSGRLTPLSQTSSVFREIYDFPANPSHPCHALRSLFRVHPTERLLCVSFDSQTSKFWLVEASSPAELIVHLFLEISSKPKMITDSDFGPSYSFQTPIAKVAVEPFKEPATPSRNLGVERCHLVTPEKDLTFPMLTSNGWTDSKGKSPFKLTPRRGNLDCEHLLPRTFLR